MKTSYFVNQLNKEQWVCDDVTKLKVIDGVTYLHVHKEGSYRKVLMRKDSLQRIEKLKK